MYGTRDDNNTIYAGSEKLILNGVKTDLPGGTSFDKYHEGLRLTAPNQKSRSLWQIPKWLKPKSDDHFLSYHKDPKHWTQDEEGNYFLQSVAKGQEFVMEVKDIEEFQEWFLNIQNPECQNKKKQNKSHISGFIL